MKIKIEKIFIQNVKSDNNVTYGYIGSMLNSKLIRGSIK